MCWNYPSSVVILIIRTWAVWHRSRAILGYLLAVFVVRGLYFYRFMGVDRIFDYLQILILGGLANVQISLDGYHCALLNLNQSLGLSNDILSKTNNHHCRTSSRVLQ